MLIISASNIVTSKEKSQSLCIANKVKDLLHENSIDSEVVDLREYKIDICTMCEKCAGTGKCVQNDDFNALNMLWMKHDKVMVICPHYAGVPAKIAAICEKIQEISYLHHCQGKHIYKKKEAVIIGHGGMTEDYNDLYKANILDPLSNMLRNCGCKMLNENIQETLCFGVKKYYEDKEENSVCYRKDDDEEKSNEIIKIAVKEILKQI